jgi:predicted RNase H-like nuclease (RuvC/YqgF family)
MKKHLQTLSLALLSAAAIFTGSSAIGATLSDVFQATEQLNAQAKRSQSKIDDLTEETRKLLNEYKRVLKEVEGLKVYNRQLEKQIGNQEREMVQLAASIDEVTIIERQITPLMLRMIDGLEQFVALDAPFLLEERTERVDRLREMMDRADVAVSEKFSQVFRAFQIENEYGRTMETYPSTIEIDGVERKVDILKVGRIALVYQTPDGAETGMYNPTTRQYEAVDNSYQGSVRQGIRMARQQASIDMLSLPVVGAGAAQ